MSTAEIAADGHGEPTRPVAPRADDATSPAPATTPDHARAAELRAAEVAELSGLDHIVVQEASEHNLRAVSLAVPKRQLTVFTGPSGSGKSSLAFDTIYAEGRRRYLDSLSTYARQFVGEIQRPAVTSVRGLGPTIAIDQKTVSNNPRSTVGTITEIYDFMRVLWAKLGTAGEADGADNVFSSRDPQAIVARVMALPPGTKFTLYGPLVRNRKGQFKDVLEDLRTRGFVRMRIDGELRDLDEDIDLKKSKRHDIDVVVDRLKVKDGIEARLLDSVQTTLDAADGQCLVEYLDERGRTNEWLFQAQPELSHQNFSFNSPVGMCPRCQGLGTTRDMSADLVVSDPSLSIKDGAIAAWQFPGNKNPLKPSREVFDSVTEALGIDQSAPFSSLTKKQQRALLNGQKKPIEVHWKRKGIEGSYEHVWEGILPDLMQTWRETSRDAVKAFLEPFVVARTCPACDGARLKPESRAVTLHGRGIHEINGMAVRDAVGWFAELTFQGTDAIIAGELVPEIEGRLRFLDEVGLGYLQLSRSGPTLSGGESQRIRLATQLGSGLTGVTYVLDEPSIGLHARDQDRLLATLRGLRDRGNTILVVEHDESTMRAADYLVDFGPGAGRRGGQIMYAGPGSQIERADSLTADYLSGRRQIEIPAERRTGNGNTIVVRGARENNLDNLTVKFPLGTLTCVTGVSGAGKSTLVGDILLPQAERLVNRAQRVVGEHRAVDGLEHLDRVVDIDQKPIGRTPRSNPATYTKVFDVIRKLFSQLPESRIYGYTPGRFSFNVAGGRCEACKGAGIQTIEMRFLADVYVPCEVCNGKRFNEATLRVRYRGHNISDILDMQVQDAAELFQDVPPVHRILSTLADVGLGYIQLGQPSPTLSGGEAQRIKLSRELARPQVGHTLYILDEPSTGLHYEDIRHLLEVLNRLVDAGNTVVVIEHNLDIIKTADHLIDLGPDGGDAGGQLVAEGTPEKVARSKKGFTPRYLKEALGSGR